MLKRMVGCAFSSGSSSSRASSATSRAVASNATTTEYQTSPTASSKIGQPSSGTMSGTGAVVAPAPAWAPRSPTREELEVRRNAERKFITDNDSTETDLWFLIDVDWLSDWKRFVLRGGPLPGPIRNDSLLDSRTGKPRQGLELVTHYRGVNNMIWKYWVARYGGGPTIRRRRLDLYAPPVHDSSDETFDVMEVDQLDQICMMQQLKGSSLGMDNTSTLSNEAVTNAPEELPKPGKAGRGRSFSDLLNLKGYRGGGRSSRSSTPKATGDAIVSSGSTSSKSTRPQATKNSNSKSEDTTCESSSSSSTGDISGMNFFIKEADACVVAQPMDGSCLFHSLSYGVDDGSDASTLRLDISNYIADNPEMVIAGTALKDWIKFDTGGKVSTYAAEMTSGGTWGGGIEIEAFTRLKDVNVHVFETCPGGYRRICCFDNSEEQRTVGLLFQGREHYDALVVNETSGKWVPRTGMASHAGA